LAAGPALAQAGNPLDPCAPPLGQQMTDMRANAALRNYRADPSPANKATVCRAIAWAVAEYRKSVTYCRPRMAQCDENFRDICERRQERLTLWQSRSRAACGR
jgi:hypothetical protein